MWGPPEVLKPYTSWSLPTVSQQRPTLTKTHDWVSKVSSWVRWHPATPCYVPPARPNVCNACSFIQGLSLYATPMTICWHEPFQEPIQSSTSNQCYIYCLWVVAWRTLSLPGTWLFSLLVAKMVGTHASRLRANMNPYEAFPGSSYPNCASSGLTPFVLV